MEGRRASAFLAIITLGDPIPNPLEANQRGYANYAQRRSDNLEWLRFEPPAHCRNCVLRFAPVPPGRSVKQYTLVIDIVKPGMMNDFFSSPAVSVRRGPPRRAGVCPSARAPLLEKDRALGGRLAPLRTGAVKP